MYPENYEWPASFGNRGFPPSRMTDWRALYRAAPSESSGRFAAVAKHRVAGNDPHVVPTHVARDGHGLWPRGAHEEMMVPAAGVEPAT